MLWYCASIARRAATRNGVPMRDRRRIASPTFSRGADADRWVHVSSSNSAGEFAVTVLTIRPCSNALPLTCGRCDRGRWRGSATVGSNGLLAGPWRLLATPQPDGHQESRSDKAGRKPPEDVEHDPIRACRRLGSLGRQYYAEYKHPGSDGNDSYRQRQCYDCNDPPLASVRAASIELAPCLSSQPPNSGARRP